MPESSEGRVITTVKQLWAYLGEWPQFPRDTARFCEQWYPTSAVGCGGSVALFPQQLPDGSTVLATEATRAALEAAA